ncbi:aminoglycoside phosphotransferase [Nonomuraea wenchangensis]|uniref:aminoglycoside phosphotransferase n=1 Tax=Nonomuraea wenchangensis TaxID=568860 RepID=UPI0011600E56|nr:aminoglycoside phosphotransferase [Nonomuraea wenchangensis]
MEKYAGRVMRAETVSDGMNSAVAMILETAFDKFFVKGLKRSYPRRWTQDMEWMIGPYVSGISPRIQWRTTEDEEWDLIGFEYIPGRHASYEPGSEDLEKLLDTMRRLGRLICPNLPLKTAESRWKTYVDKPEDLRWFVGERLLHTDYNPLNVLVSDGRALLIDWAWPTKGAGWIDPACLILRLIAGGHTPEEAEMVASGLPAWKEAPTKGLDAFFTASINMWREIAEADSAQWKAAMLKAAQDWHNYRVRA